LSRRHDTIIGTRGYIALRYGDVEHTAPAHSLKEHRSMPHGNIRAISGITRRSGLRRAAARLRAARHVLITTHLHPDPDALGSSLTLASALERIGIRAEIVVGSPVPERYAFMDEAQRIRVLGEDESLPEADVVVILDTSAGWDRLGEPGAAIAARFADRLVTVICLDHHPHPHQPADIRVVDPQATAASVLVYHLVLMLTNDITPEEAGWLYLGIVTDTSSFRFPNTNPEAYRIVADLSDRGANQRQLYAAMYERTSVERLRLLGEALMGVQLVADGQIAVVIVTRDQFIHHGLAVEDGAGFADYAATVEGAEVGAALLEYPDGSTRVILRATRTAPVDVIAKALGGGGHAFAAAAVIDSSAEEALRRLVDASFPALATEFPSDVFPAAD